MPKKPQKTIQLKHKQREIQVIRKDPHVGAHNAQVSGKCSYLFVCFGGRITW